MREERNEKLSEGELSKVEAEFVETKKGKKKIEVKS